MKLFQVNNLSYSYEQNEVFSHLSFTIDDGKTLGIIGPNGAGKTTLLKALSGSIHSYNGEIILQGKRLKSYSKKELAKNIAFVEQEGTPLISFSVEEVVLMGRYPWLKPFGNYSSRDYQLVEEALYVLGIGELRRRKVYQLSGGERQLISLARAMVQEPRILFLDEPTTYLDIGHQQLIMKHIRKWQQEKGATVIMVLHDINLAAQYADELLLMEKNSSPLIGRVEEILSEKNLEKVYSTKTIMIEHPISKVPQVLMMG